MTNKEKIVTIKKLPIIINEKYKTNNDDFFPFFFPLSFYLFLLSFLSCKSSPGCKCNPNLFSFFFIFLFPDLDYTHLYDMQFESLLGGGDNHQVKVIKEQSDDIFSFFFPPTLI